MSEKTYDFPESVECPGGPLLVRGDQLIEGPDGSVHRTTRPVSAVCRCQRSAILPWCDGTHKVIAKKST